MVRAFDKKKMGVAGLVAGLVFICISLPAEAKSEKIGILFTHVGQSETYAFDWIPQFFDAMYDNFEPGIFSGGIEGGACYSLIHYADEQEAAICNVAPGTPIDALCTPYEGGYPVHSVINHVFAMGDKSFSDGCSTWPSVFFPLAFGHSTVDPATGKKIMGPHIDDPNGPGMGIADFQEFLGFSLMKKYYRLPNHRLMHRYQALRFWYGNDIPAYYGYTPDIRELENVKGSLAKLYPDRTFAFRHGWEVYRRNLDPYGKQAYLPDSIETAVSELLHVEKVDRIIVLRGVPYYTNFAEYGHDWYDDQGRPISQVEGETFRQCVEDLGDGAGPATEKDLSSYISNRPWEKHDTHIFPLIKDMVAAAAPGVQLVFAPAYGSYREFGLATAELVKYTITKYAIPPGASLKLVLAHHGNTGFYGNAQQCDCYFRNDEDLYGRVKKVIEESITRPGRFEIANGAGEYAEAPSSSAPGDTPSFQKPFGAMMSEGEQIDVAINGK